MAWWMWVAVGLVIVGFVGWEWRLYRMIESIKYGSSNGSSQLAEGQKKAPAQAEAGTGIEYGGHHLP